MHPFDRCTMSPVFPWDDGEGKTRWARNVSNGTAEKIPANMTYAQWRKMQDGLDVSAGGSSLVKRLAEEKENFTKASTPDKIKAPADYQKQSSKSIRKGIKSLETRKQEHLKKIDSELANPDESPEDKNRLVSHWQKEIKTFEKQIEASKQELERREAENDDKHSGND